MPENGAVSMAHRAGSKQTSTMLDWVVELKGKAALVLAMLFSILRSNPGQKRIADTQ